ncbi:sugar ABC transporter permease [bacterium]|nr:MAG: sugar ABC transporter permease [bacterium]
MKRKDGLAAVGFLAPYGILFVTFLLVPLVYGFWISMHKWQLLSQNTPFVGAANYASILKDELFRISVVRTALFVVLAVPLGNLLSLALAAGLNQNFRTTSLLKVLFYLPVVLSVSVVALLWRWMYDPSSGIINRSFNLDIPWLSNAHWAMPSFALMSIWWGAGGNMLVYLAALKGVPKELHEAAELDGAVGLRRFWKTTLPLIRPALAFGVVMSFIGASQVFGQIYIITNGGGGPAYSTLSVILYMYQQGFSNYELGYASAVAYTLFVLVLLVTFFLLKALRADDPAM